MSIKYNMNLNVSFLIFLQIKVIYNLNFTENNQLYYENYKNNRCSRCVVSNTNLNFILKKAKDLFVKSEKIRTLPKGLVTERNCEGKLNLEDNGFFNLSSLHWNEFKAMFNKNYFSFRHEMAALEKWRQNLQKVVEHNQEYLAGKQSYTLQLNIFGDMHVSEYFKKILKLIKTIPLFDPAEDFHRSIYRINTRRKIPRKVDWRQLGYRPALEEQWQCGACYAFAVSHAVQAQLFRKHGDWRELSPQQIVDCSISDGNMGCDGGSLRAALRYAARAGLVSERKYPYKGQRGRCHYNPLQVSTHPHRWAALPKDEAAIERAVALIGPLPVGINASPFTFQLYRSGIYDDPFCFPWGLNHAMLLVGYTEEYWILLNWWGKSWGEDGYMRIRRGSNRCGIDNMAMYVEI